MKKIKEIYIITLILIIIGITTSFAASGIVHTNGVRMRKEPSVESEIITNLHNGNKVEIIAKEAEWYKIKYEGQEGYIHSNYVKTEETIEEINPETPAEGSISEEPVQEQSSDSSEENIASEPEVIYPKTITLVANTKIYIMPSVTANIVLEVETGKTITVNYKVANWSYIDFEGQKGWVRNYALENAVEEIETPNSEEIPAQNTEMPTFTVANKYVNVDSANIRQESNKESNILGTVAKDVKVVAVGEENGWYKIEYGEIKGYILKTLVSDDVTNTTSRSSVEPREETVTPISKLGYVNVNVANVREVATTSSAIVTTLKIKDKIDITGEEGDFYQITINEKTAYISKGLIVDSLEQVKEEPKKEEVKPVKVSSTGKSTGDEIVNFAKQYVGYKYVYGGTTPSGFDCSGFVYYVYNSCGYNLSRACSVQAKSGTSVSKAELQPGDLIFFNNSSDGGIGHVGIYVGGGKFVHAANSKRGVVIDTINSGYYNTYYYSARRIV